MAKPSHQKIIDVVTYRGWGGYFFEDIDKIRQSFIPPADRYHTPTGHDRYPFVRTPAPVVGIGLKLDDGSIHWGDAVAVSFGGKSGRAGPGHADSLIAWVQDDFKTWCKGRTISRWIEIEREFLAAFKATPPFVRYAVSQAMVSAAIHTTGETPHHMIATDLGLTPSTKPIPLHGSSGADFGATVDRMLARNLSFLPQGQFENLTDQIGQGGVKLLAWIRDFKQRAARFKYTPTMTLDFHGALDVVFAKDDGKIADFIVAMAKEAFPHALHVESPIVGASLQDHSNRFAAIRAQVKKLSPATKLVADEWANEVSDIESLIKSAAVDGIHIKMPDTGALSECAAAVQACKTAGIFALLGGSCTETDIGARASAHLALATQPDALLVKPGMGFDESFAMLFNEMARASRP